MKQFNKTLLVAALMVAAGSANANISVNNGNSELFMSVYDSSSKNTYSLNTGLTIDAFIAAAMDVNYTYTYDLSSDNVWVSSFLGAAGFNAATTVYALAVASNINPDVLLTSSAAGGLALADNVKWTPLSRQYLSQIKRVSIPLQQIGAVPFLLLKKPVYH